MPRSVVVGDADGIDAVVTIADVSTMQRKRRRCIGLRPAWGTAFRLLVFSSMMGLGVAKLSWMATEPWKIDPNSINYTWPWVHSYCLPCKKKKVGTCFTSPCYPWRGATECSLTRCVCAEGYCAAEDNKPGREVCEPQICKTGPRPLPFIPSTVVYFFHWLGGEADFPDGEVTEERFTKFVLEGLVHHCWLLGFAVLVIVATVLAFWQYKPPHRKRLDVAEMSPGGTLHSKRRNIGKRTVSGLPPMAVLAEMPELQRARSLIIVEEGPDGKPIRYRKVYRRPRPFGLLSFVGVVVLIIVAVIVLRDRNWGDTMLRVHSLLDMVMENARQLKRMSQRVDHTCGELEVSMHALARDCQHDPMMSMIDNETLASTDQYVATVHRLHSILKDLPRMVHKVKHLVHEKEATLFWVPLLPVLVLAVVTTVMIVEAIIVTCVGKIKMVLWFDKSLRLAIVPYSLLIMFVAVFCLIGFAMASTFSSFCVDVDNNMLTLASSFTEPRNLTDVYEMCEFYLKGSGTNNPAAKYSKMALQQINLIYDVYLQFKPVVDSYGVSCPALKSVKIEQISREAKYILRHCSLMLEPANLYPIYQKMVHEALCRDLVASLASFPVFTVILGLVVYPLSAVFTHRFLVSWAMWKKSHAEIIGDQSIDEWIQASDSESEESDDDDDTFPLDHH